MYHGTLEVVRTFPSTETAYTLQAVMIPLGTEGLNYITLTEEEESGQKLRAWNPQWCCERDQDVTTIHKYTHTHDSVHVHVHVCEYVCE